MKSKLDAWPKDVALPPEVATIATEAGLKLVRADGSKILVRGLTADDEARQRVALAERETMERKAKQSAERAAIDEDN